MKHTQKAIKEYYRDLCEYYRNLLGCRNYKPNRALVEMYWEDESPDQLNKAVIALTPYDIMKDDDDDILFYAGGLKGLLDLTKPNNGSDFVLVNVLEFYRED